MIYGSKSRSIISGGVPERVSLKRKLKIIDMKRIITLFLTVLMAGVGTTLLAQGKYGLWIM